MVCIIAYYTCHRLAPGVDPRATSYSRSLVIQLKYCPVLPSLNKVDYYYHYYLIRVRSNIISLLNKNHYNERTPKDRFTEIR